MSESSKEMDRLLGDVFATANAPLQQGDAFVKKVMSSVPNKRRRRTVVLSGAATTGSAIAAEQLTDLVAGFSFESPLLAQGFDLLGPDAVVAIAFAILAGIVGLALPNRTW